ncbi:hypothetical protein AGLY_011918 [Aphis glycines]|uniref:Reverse transcriptase domain-containing protein n=1 Tax=Aphis glycines TaxID=307491 RepID=A0A6G0TAJ8_APHGL|nr:hypothetical protein AGLY_011918 [Aphis glycines]
MRSARILSSGHQWVKLFGGRSNLLLASSGVLQGGHLSPILFSILVNGVVCNSVHCRLLCYADDIKLFLLIDSPYDYVELQGDLDYFVTWFQTLGFSFNIDKYHIMTYSRTPSLILNTYHSGTYNIAHVNYIIYLEYNVRFYHSFGFSLGIPYPPHDYTPIYGLLELNSLADGRVTLDLKLLYGILRGKTASSYLLSQLNFKVPHKKPDFTIHSMFQIASNSLTIYLMNH